MNASQTKRYHGIPARALCILLMLLMVMPGMTALLVLNAPEAEAAGYIESFPYLGNGYQVIGRSTGSVKYYGRSFATGTIVNDDMAVDSGIGPLTFSFTSGYLIQKGSQIYYAGCGQAGYYQPNTSMSWGGLLPITAHQTHIDGKNYHRYRYMGDHGIGTGTDEDRKIDYDWIFACFYYGNELFGNPQTSKYKYVNWNNCWLEEAVSIAYRYEWDTRMVMYVTGQATGGRWVDKDTGAPSTQYTNTLHTDWTTPNNAQYVDWTYERWTVDKWIKKDPSSYNAGLSFLGWAEAVGQEEHLVDAANEILYAAAQNYNTFKGKVSNINPTTGETDPYGLYYKDSKGDVHVLRLLDAINGSDGTNHALQDLFLYAVNETPPDDETYEINLTKYVKGTSTKLADATFELRTKNASGAWVAYTDDGTNGRRTTTTSSSISWTTLPEGDYRIYEISAPDGYETMDVAYIEVTLPGSSSNNKSQSDVYSVTYNSDGNANVTVYDPKLYSITLDKYDKDDWSKTSKTRIGGADFKLEKQNTSGTWSTVSTITSRDDRAISWNDLEEGYYRITETKAPDDYAIMPETIYIRLDGSSHNVSSVNRYKLNYNSGNAVVEAYEYKTGNIKIKKVGIKDTPISGVTFSLYKSSTKSSANLIASGVTNSSGEVIFDGQTYSLEDGKTYYLYETDAPAGYDYNPNKVYEVTVIGGQTVEANGGTAVKNQPSSFSVQVIKHAKDSIMVFIEGAEFQLYKKNATTGYYDKYDVVKVTDRNGQITWSNLKDGDYGLKEISVPTGWEYDDTMYCFSIPDSVADGGNGVSLNTNVRVTTTQTGRVQFDIQEEPENYYSFDAKKILNVNEKYTDRKLQENEFWFQLIEVEWTDEKGVSQTPRGVIQTLSNDANGNVKFDTLAFGKNNTGTHRYNIVELTSKNGTAVDDTHSGQDNTVWYTNVVKSYTINVTYTAGNGEKPAEINISPVSGSATNEFPNYVPYGEWTPTAKKVLVGRTLQWHEFTFKLEEQLPNGTWTQVGNIVANYDVGTIEFPKIIYQLQDAGTHTYRISEVIPANSDPKRDPNVRYDNTYVTWKVTVEYFGGTGTGPGYGVDLKVTPELQEKPIDDFINAGYDSKGNPVINGGNDTFVNYVSVKIVVHKENHEGLPLEGVKFRLEWSDDDGETWNLITFNSLAPYPFYGECYQNVDEDGCLATNANGELSFTMLYPTLMYRLTEVETNDGYQLLTEPVFVGKINPDDNVYEVNATVVNMPIFTMPKTGNNGFIWLTFLTTLMSFSICFAIFANKKHKYN